MSEFNFGPFSFLFIFFFHEILHIAFHEVQIKDIIYSYCNLKLSFKTEI